MCSLNFIIWRFGLSWRLCSTKFMVLYPNSSIHDRAGDIFHQVWMRLIQQSERTKSVGSDESTSPHDEPLSQARFRYFVFTAQQRQRRPYHGWRIEQCPSCILFLAFHSGSGLQLCVVDVSFVPAGWFPRKVKVSLSLLFMSTVNLWMKAVSLMDVERLCPIWAKRQRTRL